MPSTAVTDNERLNVFWMQSRTRSVLHVQHTLCTSGTFRVLFFTSQNHLRKFDLNCQTLVRKFQSRFLRKVVLFPRWPMTSLFIVFMKCIALFHGLSLLTALPLQKLPQRAMTLQVPWKSQCSPHREYGGVTGSRVVGHTQQNHDPRSLF